MTTLTLDTPSRFFRTAIARSHAVRIEPDGGRFGAGVIRDVAVITQGEALGHDLWIDAEFVDSVTAAVNAADNGIKSRFTHPGLSGDGLGTTLGRVFDARTEDGRTIADLHFFASAHDTPDGDLAAYVMTLAGEGPEDFGLSIAFALDLAAMESHRLLNTNNGRFVSPDENNRNNLEHARLERLRAVDAVDSPAANPEGLFQRKQEAAADAEALVSYSLGLSDHRPTLTCFDIDPDRVAGFVSRFLDRHNLALKGAEMADNSTPVDPVEEDVVAKPTREDFTSELKRYTDAFGAERGAEWFTAGLSWEDAQAKQIEHLQECIDRQVTQIGELNDIIQSLDAGEPQPAEFQSEQPETEKRTLASRIRIASAN